MLGLQGLYPRLRVLGGGGGGGGAQIKLSIKFIRKTH